jgi:hypothetical protein
VADELWISRSLLPGLGVPGEAIVGRRAAVPLVRPELVIGAIEAARALRQPAQHPAAVAARGEPGIGDEGGEDAVRGLLELAKRPGASRKVV